MGGWISGSVDQWISGSVDQWISERCMYVTPIRLDLLLNTSQISCYKGKWYERRFDPDTVENGHIYSSVKEEEVFIYIHTDIQTLFSSQKGFSENTKRKKKLYIYIY